LAIDKLLSAVKSEFVLGYLDDITIGGHASTVVAEVSIVQQTAQRLGLSLNHRKSEVIGSTPLSRQLFHTAALTCQEIDVVDASLLGTPLSEAGVDGTLLNKRAELTTLLTRLHYLQLHDSLYLLKNVFTIPKLMYLLRTAPCFKSIELINYDIALRDSLSILLNVKLEDDNWMQASLPVWAGGLGIRGAEALAPSAFLASVSGTTDLVTKLLPQRYLTRPCALTPLAQAKWQAVVGINVALPQPPASFKQRTWDSAIASAMADQSLSAVSDHASRARLLACRSRGAGDWLHALPLANIGLKLSDAAVSIAISLRIGCPAVHEHTCVCGATVQTNGHHGLSCLKSAGRQSRHTSVNDIIHRSLHSAGIQAIREPPCLSSQSNLHPDGVTLLPWRRGKPMIWDFTCPDTLAPSHINQTSARAGAAADTTETNKRAKYASFAEQYEVIPVAVETMGLWGEQAFQFVQALGVRIAITTGDPRSAGFLRQRIAIAIQRGNAAAVLTFVATEEERLNLFHW